MSFGLLKHFKDSTGASAQKTISNHYQHVILGQDLGAVLKLLEIKKKAPDQSVRLITTRALNRASLLENYELGVSQIRSQSALENIYRKHHNADFVPQVKDPSFYKDGKFHEFSGRAKSMDLLTGEDFFSHKGYKLKLASLFSPEDWENLDVILNQHAEIRIFESVEKTVPQDLVDIKEWLFTFKDFVKITCENLYVSMSPKKFLNYIHNKDSLTPEFIDVCTSVYVQAAISVSWELDKEIFPEGKTLFIPQSMTHEWGHFIVEFEDYDYQKNLQACHALFLIQDEEPQSEELAGKIKLMKRVLDRVFPNIEKHMKKEFIRFDEEMFISNIKDVAIEQLSFDYPSLKFLGQMGSVEGHLTNEKFLSRVLLS